MASVNSGIANTRFVWAPEFYVEGSTVRVIVSIAQTTCSACFRPYVFTAQNSALTSWSGPVQMGGLGFNYIDTYVVRSGTTYHAFVKNETSKFIEHWTSTSLTSGWTNRGSLWTSGLRGTGGAADGRRHVAHLHRQVHQRRHLDGHQLRPQHLVRPEQRRLPRLPARHRARRHDAAAVGRRTTGSPPGTAAR